MAQQSPAPAQAAAAAKDAKQFTWSATVQQRAQRGQMPSGSSGK